MAGARHFPIYKILALLLSVAVLLTTAFGGTFAHIVTKTPSFINTFLSGLDPSGDLIIQKEVRHPFGSGYALPEGLSFDFTVSFGTEYAGKTVKTSLGEFTADETGRIIVSVAPNSAVRIRSLAKGTSVTVTEAAVAGFTPEGGAERSLTIQTGENRLAYTNVYAPGPVDPVNLTVNGTKLLEGRAWQEGDSFTFRLEYKLAGNEAWQTAGTTSVAYDPANADFNKFSFTEMVQGVAYDAAGEYSFRVSEVEGTVPGITYDQVVSYFDVTVGDDDMDGALEIWDVKGYQNAGASYDESTGSYCVAVTVNNKYAPAGTAVATIQIDKQVKSLSGEERSAAGYTFALYDESGSLVATSGETSAAGEASIALIYEAKDAGKTFRYALKETHGGETINGMVYDDTVYPISVSIVDDLDGTISAHVYSGEEAVEAASGEVKAKEVEAEQVEAAETILAATSELPVEIVAELGLPNTVPESTEVPENSIVTEAKDIAVIPESASNVCVTSFVNVYDPADIAVSFSGTKELTGRNLKEGEFTFDLYTAGDNFVVAEGQDPVQSMVNDADGNFGFTSLAYSEVGVYRYVVKENDAAKLGGITYDESEFHVIVTVTDENGILKADTSITDELGAPAEIKFQNSYKAAPALISLYGTKTLTGKELEENMFRFRLYSADENYTVRETVPKDAFNDADGQFAFERIEHAETGTFYYVVKEEVDEDVEGMTYDDTVYGVKVSVWDDGSGILKTAVVLTVAGGEEVDAILFENSYTKPVDPDVPLTGDDSAVTFYIIVAVISAAAVILLLMADKRKVKRRHL